MNTSISILRQLFSTEVLISFMYAYQLMRQKINE
jgi:hypothetical protein